MLRVSIHAFVAKATSDFPSVPSGYLTAVLANHWVHDSGDTQGPARLLSHLGGHFDLVLQSCRTGHRVPEAAMFSAALQHLGVTSQQVEAPSATWLYSPRRRLVSAYVVSGPVVGRRRGWREGSRRRGAEGHLGGKCGGRPEQTGPSHGTAGANI